jgi:hypothetical protein
METKFGTVPESLNIRDCVHTPCVSCWSDYTLSPGDRVVFVDYDKVVPTKQKEYDGIVDPFLNDKTLPCNIVWVLAKPNTVTNIRHTFVLETDGKLVYRKNPKAIETPEDISVQKEFILRLQGEIKRLKDEIAEQDGKEEYDSCRGCY